MSNDKDEWMDVQKMDVVNTEKTSLELYKINREAKGMKKIHMAKEKVSKKQVFESIGTKSNPSNTIKPMHSKSLKIVSINAESQMCLTNTTIPCPGENQICSYHKERMNIFHFNIINTSKTVTTKVTF